MSSSMASFQFGALPQPRGALMSEELELGVISDGVVSFAATARDVPTVDDNSFPLDLLRLPVRAAAAQRPPVPARAARGIEA